MILDIGAGNTEIGIFEGSSFVYTNTIPLGGNNISNDISLVLNISEEEAEKLKSEIHQVFYRKAQESKIKDLDNLLKEELKKTTFFLRRKARHLREKYNSCNQIEKDWKNQLEVEKDRFLDNIHVY